MKRINGFAIASWLTVVAGLLFAVINLSEFVTVGMLKQTSTYPFGVEGPTPSPYKDAEIYAAVRLLDGLLYLVVIALAAWAIRKRSTKKLVTAAVALFMLILF